MIIDLKDYDINYSTFRQWCMTGNMDVIAINNYNSSGVRYRFGNPEDFLAFSITFKKLDKPANIFYGIAE